TSNFQSSRENAFGAQAAIDACLHALINLLEALPDLRFTLPCFLVSKSDLPNRDSLLFANSQQICPAREWIWHVGPGFDGVSRLLAFSTNETAANRVINQSVDNGTVCGECSEPHAIGVTWQSLRSSENEISPLLKFDRMTMIESDDSAVPNLLNHRLD